MGTVNSESVRRVAVISSSPMERGMIHYALVLDDHQLLDAGADRCHFLAQLRGGDIGLLVMALPPAVRELSADVEELLGCCRAQSVPALVMLDHDSRILELRLKRLGASICLSKPLVWGDLRYWCTLLLHQSDKESAP